MQLTVTPVDGPVDATPRILLQGLESGDEARVRLEVVDAAGHPWSSENTYRAAADGTVDVARDAPVHGTYVSADPAGPFWSMLFDERGEPPVAFTAPWDQLAWTCTAWSDPAEPVSLEVVRRWSTGIERRSLAGEGFRGICFAPGRPSAEPRPGVVIVPGSTGPEAVTPVAALLASSCGFPTMVLGYMGEEGLPEALTAVPLESLANGMRRWAAEPGVDGDRLAVVAYSVGTGGALATLALEELPVSAVVVVSPTHVIWQALAAHGQPPKASSWTHRGQELPWVRMRAERLLPEMARHAVLGHLPARRPRSTALHLRPAYEAALKDSDAVGTARIPVERISAPVMAIAGTADAMWPSADMASAIITARGKARPGETDTARHDRLLLLDRAGHFIRPPLAPTTVDRNADLVSGGDPDGIAAAERVAWNEMTEFLSRHLRNS